MRLLKLIPDNTNLDFLRWRNVAMIISALLLAASIGLIAVKGLNFGVDFAGGQVIRTTFAQPPSLDTLRTQVADFGLGDPSIQEFGSDREISIRLPLPPGGEEGEGGEQASLLIDEPHEPASEGVALVVLVAVAERQLSDRRTRGEGSELVEAHDEALAVRGPAEELGLVIVLPLEQGIRRGGPRGQGDEEGTESKSRKKWVHELHPPNGTGIQARFLGARMLWHSWEGRKESSEGARVR